MNNKTLYYDPIYNQIVLPSIAQFGSAAMAHNMFTSPPSEMKESDINKAIHNVITYEKFHRLSFLNQSGIAWLVFPSATHTRFAHSIGCYHLGTLALDYVHVRHEETSENIILAEWLNRKLPDTDNDYKNSYHRCLFLTSLLCHDIGHFPFSHTMELNHDIDIDFTHEDRISDVLTDDFYESFKEIPCPRYGKGDRKTVECFKSALAHLISDKPFEDAECLPPEHVSCRFNHIKLVVLKKLVSGLLDLDRIDHYNRDSVFTGTKLANFHVEQLLRGMTFIVSYKTDEVKLALTRDALIHAKNLLHSKEQISDAMFENPDVINYEIILNQCITKYKGKTTNNFNDIYSMSDWQLLNALDTTLDEEDEDKAMFRRIEKKEQLYFISKFILKGKYNIIFDNAGNVTFKFNDDDDHKQALSDFYKIVLLGFDLLADNPELPDRRAGNQVFSFIENELIWKHRSAVIDLTGTGDDKLMEVLLIKYLFSHELYKVPHDSACLAKIEKLLKLLGRSLRRKLSNAVKREFAEKLKKKLKDELIINKVADTSNTPFYMKFSKKFLDFHNLSQDVRDFACILIDNSMDGLGSYSRIIDDSNEKDFLGMIAAKDIKSRINMWLYTDHKLDVHSYHTIIKSLNACGFVSVRG